MGKLETYVEPAILRNVAIKFVFVSDSDQKLVAALRDDFDRQSCAVHDLSLAVKAALKLTEGSVAVMIEDSKVLVQHFKRNGLNRNLSATLKQDVPTRFNSIYTMLQSIDNVFDEVTTALTSSDNITYLANIKRKTLQALCKELKRFDEATHRLAVENKETLHLVVPILFELKSKMTKQAERYGTEHPDMAKLCKVLATSVQEKCIHKLTWYHVAAVLMYPEYRNHPCMSEMEAEIDRLRLDLQGMISSMDGPRCLGEPEAKKPKTVLIDSDTESDDKESENEGFAERAGNELDSYLRSTFDCDDGRLSPLEFWKKQAKCFPKLAQIARSIYAIPATQNKSERAFSAASHVMTDLRTTLDPEHLDELLLIRSQYKH